MSALRIGVIGVGVISGTYLDRLPGLPGVEVVAVADLDAARVAAVAADRGVRGETVDGLLSADDVDLVINLTIPAAHAEVATRALDAGKHVHGEKPLALTTDEGRAVLALAAARGLQVGSAPDTVLGTGIQTARALIDQGAIGDPVGASVHWSAPGHELWHPAPEFYYQPGAGPLFDMGPYYLTALVTLLGPVVRVAGTATRSGRERTIATGPRAGAVIPVAVETHVSALLTHASGVVSTATVSFEEWATRRPLFEVAGTAGTIAVPDPNGFDGTVELWTPDRPEWAPVEPLAGYVDTGRGIGVADLAGALVTGRRARASGELALHVLEIMESVLDAARDSRVVELTTTVERPDAVPLGASPAD